MMMRAKLLGILAIVAALPVFSAADTAGGGSDSGRDIHAITKPSGDVTLSFVHPGLITKMFADLGDTVKAKQLVATQDSSEEVIQLEAAKKEAESETEINAERKVREADKLDLDRKVKSGGTSQSEISEAEVKVQVDDARIELAIFKKEQALYKYQAANAGIEKFNLNTPIDGVVAETMIHVGEVTDGQNTKVMRIVQVDPLWVDVPVPFAQAQQLKANDPAQVTFSDKQVRDGKVLVVSQLGNSASKTINVRVAIPNPQKRQSGENVLVNFSPAIAGVVGAK